jgi:hypothetical protein
VFSCHTDSVLKNVTIALSEEAAHWVRMRAAEDNISVSRLIGKMLEAQMRQTDDYQYAYRRWQRMRPMDIDADEDANTRR